MANLNPDEILEHILPYSDSDSDDYWQRRDKGRDLLKRYAEEVRTEAAMVDGGAESSEAERARWEASVQAEADAHGGVLPPHVKYSGYDKESVVRLPLPPTDAAPVYDTETLLNGLIADLRDLLRDVAFRTACLTPDPDDRFRFLASAQHLARTGAKVGDTIARLRGGNAPPAPMRHQRITVEHVQTITRGGVPAPQSVSAHQ